MSMPAAKSPPPEDNAEFNSLHWSAVRSRYSAGTLLEGARRNLGLRIISVLLAVGLWIFVNAGQHGATQSFNVPISYRGLSNGFLITNPHPDFVKIQVSGPRGLLSLIEPNHLTMKLDLSGVGVGQVSFKIGPDAFNVPRQTSVTSISPSQVILDVDRTVTRDAPVHLAFTGKVASGYKIASTDVAPQVVELRGPSHEVARIDQIDTERVDLAELDTDATRTVALVAPGGLSHVDPAEVTVKILLTPVIAEKEFRALPVQVRGTDYRYRIQPAHVDVTLRGPMLVLSKLDLNGAAYVEGEAMTPGYYSLPVQINLPDGVQLVRQSAETVRLRIYRERQAANG